MKKITLILTLTILGLTSCLKDKGFNNFEYGINDPGGQPKGVSFPLASDDLYNVGLDAVSSTLQTISDAVVVITETGDVPTTNVAVKLVLDPTIVSSYNTANSTNVILLRPDLYSLSALDIVIPAGKTRSNIDIRIPKTTTMSLDTSYGLGFRIVSVDNGFTIAKNLQKLFVKFSLKNKYDGLYKLEFSNYHPSLNPTYSGNTTNVELRTTSPNSNKIWWPTIPGFGNPAVLNGGFSYFGTQEPEYTFNIVNNKVTVQNAASGAVTFYTMGVSSNDYNPVTKEINVRFGYSYVGGVFATTSREWTQKFKYLGPR